MSFPRYPKYKDSGVEWLGDVPEHWGVRRLRFIAELNPSKSEISQLARETVVSFLPMESVGDDGTLSLDKEKTIGEVESGYTYFRDGDVTVAKITPCFENSKGALMCGLANGIGFGTTELIVVRPRPDELLGSYLHFLFISTEFRGLGESHMYGAGGQKRVPDAFVRNFATAFPPVTEQTAIAAFLDRETGKIDELVAEQRRLIELLKEKRQAVISHAVTKGRNPHAPTKPSGIQWLGDVPEHWDTRRFQRCVYVAEGQVDPEDPQYSSMNLIAPNHIESGTGQLLSLVTAADQGAESGKYYCEAGDVVYSKIRPALKKVCIAPAACLCSAHMYPLRPHSGLTNEFLFWLILTEHFSAFAVLESERVAMPKINRESLKEVSFALPPIDDQGTICRHIHDHVREFDTLTTEAQRGIELLQERRTALISAAVTGKIDVRNLLSSEVGRT